MTSPSSPAGRLTVARGCSWAERAIYVGRVISWQGHPSREGRFYYAQLRSASEGAKSVFYLR